ncbi:MAG: glycosyltransferase, partial [Flavobacteriales bacterium]|nr:glycosyltransferase [Flavobacteriales bacterium]
LEKEVLQNSDVCLTVSETWVESFKDLGSNNVKLVTNGFDEEDFTIKEKENDKFIIGHFGLLNHLRNPKNLWKTLHDLCDENPEFNEKLEIRLSGNIDTEVLQNITQYFHLKTKVKVLGYLSHKEVLNQYNEASVLLLLLFNSVSGIGNYPGKIFEYFAAKRPILAFGPKESDTQKLMEKTKSGIYHDYSDDNLKESIISLFENKEEFIASDKINNFTRKKLTQQLSDLLDKM